MESNTQSIDIDAPAAVVFELLADGNGLPSWTNGFVSRVHETGPGVWRLETPRGPLSWRIVGDASRGTVDFFTEVDHPDRATYARVVPRGEGSVVMLTMIRWPDLDAERFASMKTALAEELRSIKSVSESRGRSAERDRDG